MKSILVLSLLSSAAAWGQAMPPKPVEPEPEAVMAVFEDGYKLTYGELKNFMGILPPAMQQTAQRDRKAFVHQFALMRKLSKVAEEEKLDQESPTKEALQFNRMYVMTNAAINNRGQTARGEAGRASEILRRQPGPLLAGEGEGDLHFLRGEPRVRARRARSTFRKPKPRPKSRRSATSSRRARIS